jgi:hypothetical protein
VAIAGTDDALVFPCTFDALTGTPRMKATFVSNSSNINCSLGSNLHHDFFCRVSYVGDVETSSKPMIGMSFDCLEDVENFYRDYAHDVGLSICIGQQKKDNRKY